MSEIQILPAEFQEELKLHYAQAIKAGYPSSAGDHEDEFFDFNVSMVSDPLATFYGRVDTDQMIEEGIHPGDIAVINKAEEPKHGDLIVTFVNNEFVIPEPSEGRLHPAPSLQSPLQSHPCQRH